MIRVEADGTQRLWRFTLDGGAPELVLAGVKPVGYHAWADDHTLVLFVLGSPASLQLADTSAGTAELLVRGINRSIQRIPGGRTISFVATQRRRRATPTLSIRELDPVTKRDHAARERGRRRARSRLRLDTGRHAGDGGEGRAVRMARGDSGWQRLADLGALGLHDVTRIAISPKGDRIAFVTQ